MRYLIDVVFLSAQQYFYCVILLYVNVIIVINKMVYSVITQLQ